ncbi:hypothetical protein HCN44_004039 [Aphidius gifuensis]|uniref:Transcriptional coactivator p15 (PC4) C-terminal domain-containing protein n=1 Tax=Aphidius gifuensis TaxID=684658 RepID=A0A834XZP0_APHGI|nr:activated RNA polymerase II transcriptional coactivator p15-like [Aphidius gifuensis]XP_044002199.1 activated RNA polymerase II transcriptional coactivator p15-like [Aphidius gifuensis]XP_044019650.1 activated RNA polymerase II transcriptional coactivator p15-like [Aphidius gifuensis]XP_044019651.1 activated RNA polymerase II transcriptional coactivator p15-like [Aphidius gifuensis]KAF7994567.1 hypothetical protein HCN44_004039 [Aphidius gifuensis]
MPKSKEYLSSTDSSDGNSSADEKPKKKKMKKEEKKEKAAKTSSKKASSSTEDKQDDVWELGNLKQVTVREFKGKTLIDIRTMYTDKNSGELKPTKKGISLSVEQWRKLVDSIEDIDKIFKSRS